MNLDTARRFARLTLAKRALDAKQRDLGGQLEALERELLTSMVDEEVSSIRVAPRAGAPEVTVHLASELWANAHPIPGSDERDYKVANSWLRRNGYGALVQTRFNVQSVSGLARELIRDGGELPKTFIRAFDVKSGPRVRVRK